MYQSRKPRAPEGPHASPFRLGARGAFAPDTSRPASPPMAPSRASGSRILLVSYRSSQPLAMGSANVGGSCPALAPPGNVWIVATDGAGHWIGLGRTYPVLVGGGSARGWLRPIAGRAAGRRLLDSGQGRHRGGGPRLLGALSLAANRRSLRYCALGTPWPGRHAAARRFEPCGDFRRGRRPGSGGRPPLRDAPTARLEPAIGRAALVAIGPPGAHRHCGGHRNRCAGALARLPAAWLAGALRPVRGARRALRAKPHQRRAARLPNPGDDSNSLITRVFDRMGRQPQNSAPSPPHSAGPQVLVVLARCAHSGGYRPWLRRNNQVAAGVPGREFRSHWGVAKR